MRSVAGKRFLSILYCMNILVILPGLFMCSQDLSTNLETLNIRHRYSVLFLGSSLTGWGMMPQQTHDIALSLGDTLDFAFVALGNGTFQMHIHSSRTLAAISQELWDFVIIQENGALSSIPENYAAVQIIPNALALDRLIHEASPAAQVILYMPPAYKNGNEERCQSDPDVCDFDGMQERMNVNYLILSDLLNAPVAPAGLVWQQVLETDSTINLWDVDCIHANFTGAYATACTIYATLLKKDPTGCMIPDLISKENGLLIQSVVKDIVFKAGS